MGQNINPPGIGNWGPQVLAPGSIYQGSIHPVLGCNPDFDHSQMLQPPISPLLSSSLSLPGSVAEAAWVLVSGRLRVTKRIVAPTL